ADGRHYTCFKADKESYSIINPAHETDWHLLSKNVYLRKTGLQIGAPAGKDWIPDHEVALSIHKNKAIPYIEVNKEQALHFLKKEDMDLPAVDKGWYIICYEGLGLGWVKSIGNRFNNYLPKHW